MNIFYLDTNPVIAAAMMTDKHVIKMILESAQIMSTAHRFLDGKCELSYVKRGSNEKSINSHWKLDDSRETQLYRATHIHHPSCKWVRESIHNYNWLYAHFIALSQEYSMRYGKIHKTYATLKDVLSLPPKNIPLIDRMTDMQIAISNKEYHIEGNAVESYRKYYIHEKIKNEKDMRRFYEKMNK